jgi:Circularly permutated YpsA SLOG family
MPSRPDPPPGPAADYERTLRAHLRRAPGRCLLTGGQTGADTAAAVAGLDLGLRVHLVFPQGFRQEDGPLTAARRAELGGAEFHELASPEFGDRTWSCVSLADAVILIDPAGGAGCQETALAASRRCKPLLSFGSAGEIQVSQRKTPRLAPAARVARWLEKHDPQVLMFAGCRASLLASQNQEAMLRALVADIMPAVAAHNAAAG